MVTTKEIPKRELREPYVVRVGRGDPFVQVTTKEIPKRELRADSTVSDALAHTSSYNKRNPKKGIESLCLSPHKNYRTAYRRYNKRNPKKGIERAIYMDSLSPFLTPISYNKRNPKKGIESFQPKTPANHEPSKVTTKEIPKRELRERPTDYYCRITNR
jgi:hypothetical protein